MLPLHGTNEPYLAYGPTLLPYAGQHNHLWRHFYKLTISPLWWNASTRTICTNFLKTLKKIASSPTNTLNHQYPKPLPCFMKWALFSSGLLNAGSSIVGALSTLLDTNRFAGLSPESTASSTWKLQPTIIKHNANNFMVPNILVF